MTEPDFNYLRDRMVIQQLETRGIRDKRVLSAFRQVQRELFVPQDKRVYAYEDHPLPIGSGQTISQPFMVALMTELLSIKEKDKVLEIGTGSGYQAAILAHLEAQVYSVERISLLAEKAKQVLNSLGYIVKIEVGDGTLGWPKFSPYDKIIVTAASQRVPSPLINQLKVGGKLVIPLGDRLSQNLTVIDKISKAKIKKDVICGCIFVPLVGEHGYKD